MSDNKNKTNQLNEQTKDPLPFPPDIHKFIGRPTMDYYHAIHQWTLELYKTLSNLKADSNTAESHDLKSDQGKA